MAIKPDADLVYFSKRSEEQKYARLLQEGFDVNFGNTYGQLSFWLADPHPHIQERFGLHQEVLVIYSQHPTTDARVMTAIENITRHPDFKHRVDKVLFLLIHSGDRTMADELVRTDRDRIIVPIHIDELSDPHRGNFFLRSLLSKYVGAIDLFGMSSPIKSDNYFFGRNDLVQSLVDRAVERRESSGLFGLRKTGKTSVLFAVQRRLADRPVLVEYFDCQNPGIHAARWWQVLDNLAVRCSETLKRDFKRDGHVQGNYSQSDAGTRFSSDMKSLLKHGNLKHIMIMIDEVEFITPRISGVLGTHWDQDFIPYWQTIRATHQETGGGVSFIVAGVNPASVERSHFEGIPNPIFQLAMPHYLEPLSVATIREMVRSIGRYAGLSFEEASYTYLRETYGGHPYLIRLACSEVWKAAEKGDTDRRTSILVNDFNKKAKDIRVRLNNPIKDILLSLVWWYPEEYDLLQILATGDEAFILEYMQIHPESLVQFAHYGVLNGDSSQFAISDLKTFLVTYGPEYKKEVSPFTRGDMPLDLLPEIPDLDVLGELFDKRCEIEIKLRRAIILYLGVKYNFDPSQIALAMTQGLANRPERRRPKQLFVGREPQEVSNELYTVDLKQIILANWDVFSPLFSNQKARFDMNMDTLNNARRKDSHTKPVTEEEKIEFENSYGWLLNRLAKIPM
jgi:hypothetical protein